MTQEITISNREQIAKINQLAHKMPYGIWLATDTALIDARSLLGIVALIGKRVKVVADNLEDRQFDELISNIEN